MQKWISVKDRLPDIKGDYLGFSPRWIRFHIIKFDEWTTGSRMRFWMNGSECVSITHWIPLPNPPEVNDE